MASSYSSLNLSSNPINDSHGQYKIERADYSKLKWLEDLLWSGDSDSSLYTQLQSAKEIGEKCFVRWSLARWCASNGNWSEAKKLVNEIIEDLTVSGLPQDPGPTLLALSVYVKTGEFDLALKLLEESPYLTQGTWDYSLALACIKFTQGKYNALSILNASFQSDGLSGLSLIESSPKSHFDRLESSSTPKKVEGPLVSVLIPVFNAADSLVTAIKSLLQQSWVNLELIVVDDCSHDNSYELAKEMAEKDKRIKVFKHHTNQGAYVARNTGLRYATGNYITVHDADDYSHCQKIEKQVEALEKNSYHKASVSHWVRCDNDLIFGTWRQEASWIHRNVSSLMFQREVFDDIGYWDCVSVNADTEYYYRILARYGKAAIKEVCPGIPLAFGRMSENTLTQQSDTHLRTQFGGVRKDYMDAAHEWHGSISSNDEFYLSDRPKKRPFNAPDLISRQSLYIGESYIPYYLGGINKASDKRVMLCGHMAGEKLFGAERSLIDMARGLSEKGWLVVITLPEEPTGYYAKALLQYSYAVVITPYHWWKRNKEDSVFVVSRFEEIIKGFNISVVGSNTLTLSAPLEASKNLGVPSVMHIRELPDFDPDLCNLLGANPSEIKEKVLGLSTGFIANSSYTLSRFGLSSKADVLENAIDIDEFDISLPERTSNKVKFGLISSNLPKKGLESFLALAERAIDQAPNASFILVGPENEYVASLIKCGLPKNVMVAGYAATASEALSDLDVVLNISDFQESFGRTVVEAMAAERPVIAYRWGAVSELIDNGVDSYLVHYKDINGLILRVKRLTEDADLRRSLGVRAKNKVRKRFNLDAYSEKINEIYLKYLEVIGSRL